MRVSAAFKYLINVAQRIRAQEGWRAAARAIVRLILLEALKIRRLIHLKRSAGTGADAAPRTYDFDLMSTTVVQDLVDSLERMPLQFNRVSFDPHALRKHSESFHYPRFYAGGSVAKGGFRENKIVEYFVSLELTPIGPDDIVIDVASEYSVFPDLVRKLFDASVFRQDLIYPPGVHEDRIGGNATRMDVDPGFATRLMLHNSFEHFEGDGDSDFIREAWRILKPGGTVCIVPLFLTSSHTVLTDPLVDRRDIEWDPEGTVVSIVGYRNRFGRFYSLDTLQRRVIEPATQCGFEAGIYYVENVYELQPGSLLHFGLVLEKAA
jgi:SAM-dependent methyltransferase